MNKKQAKARAKAKVLKARVLKVQKLAEDRHLIATEYEVHGPAEALPAFTEPVEIVPKKFHAAAPESHWYDFLTNW
jgi:hypothetical protein